MGAAPELENYLLPDTSDAGPVTEPVSLPEYPVADTPKPKKAAVKRAGQQVSGNGYLLPTLDQVQWESNDQGGWEAWHVPPGVTQRKGKTYLGFLGKRALAKMRSLTEPEFVAAVQNWTAEKRAGKSINWR